MTEYSNLFFKGPHLNGPALERSQDFTKNTLDIKTSTGIGATTAAANVTQHDVIIIAPLNGIIETKEAKAITFKSKKQFFIYGSQTNKNRDKWSDVQDYYDSYGSNPTNVIIFTNPNQILIARESYPVLYSKLITKPLFIDEIHLFTQEWRIELSTFINLVTREWQANYKLSTATRPRHFNEIFSNDVDVCILERENSPRRKLLKTNSTKQAWNYVFAEMAAGRQMVIFSNDINHHKKQFIEDHNIDDKKIINLTGEGLRAKLSPFGKGLDHHNEDIDTDFLNKFPLIFCSSKYLTGYDIEPTQDTSILILTNNKDQSTSYSVEDIIQAYGRVRINLVNTLVCAVKGGLVGDKAELDHIYQIAQGRYSLAKLSERETPKNKAFNPKSYNGLALDKYGYASKLLAYDSYLNTESEYIMYNEFDNFMNSYGFDVEPLELNLSEEDLSFILDIQKTQKSILKGVNIDRKIKNIIAGAKGRDLHSRILELAFNPKTKKNRGGYSCELISEYCIAFFSEYLPAQLFKKIHFQDHRYVKTLSNEIIKYLDTNYADNNLRIKGVISMEYDNQLLTNTLVDFVPGIDPDHFNEVVRIFRYANHNLNLSFDTLGDDSKKTIEMYYLISKYRAMYEKPSRVKQEVLRELSGYKLTKNDTIRIDKNIASRGVLYKMDKKVLVRMYVNQIKDASMYLMSRNKGFVVSFKDGREYNPLTQISTVFRENFLFNYASIDVVSANAQFTDKILNTNIALDIYSNLMAKRALNRSEVKVLYNSTLNNNKLTLKTALKVYLDSGYAELDAYTLAKLTAGTIKGSYFKRMAYQEGLIMAAYNEKFCYNSSALRLHDSLIIEDYGVTFPNEYKGITFKVDKF